MSEFPAALRTAIADRYVVDRPLGEGGMATVYLAEDVKHRRPGNGTPPSRPSSTQWRPAGANSWRSNTNRSFTPRRDHPSLRPLLEAIGRRSPIPTEQ